MVVAFVVLVLEIVVVALGDIDPQPMMGLISGKSFATLKNSFTPYIFPWSVMAIPGIPSFDALLKSPLIEERPSRMEYWVWT